jgi:hypothetical protein
MAGSVMEDLCGRKRGAGAFLCAHVTIKVARSSPPKSLAEPRNQGLIVPAKSGVLFDIVAAG